MSLRIIIMNAVAVFTWTCLFSVTTMAQTSGPERGSLVIVGGGMQDLDILVRFGELAGGLDAPIVVIPTAGGADNYDQSWQGLQQFRDAGLTNITLLHTYDPAVADTDAFAGAIQQAQGVWFTGGRQWRLADAYINTKVHDALWDLLSRDGVIGGSSAGATILGSYLARGDTSGNTIMMGDHEEGLGFIENVAIDQHLLRRNRHFDLIEIIEEKPELLGIGLDENTAIIVQNNKFEVIGQSYVAIFDHNRMLDSGGKFYFLRIGDQYDLLSRQALRTLTAEQPIERVVEKTW